ncbi:MAG TPA: hypothetical protein VF041_15450 [Gemmatimonadaceae bacterium]
MVDKPQAAAADSKETTETATPAETPRRAPGHRSTDARDTVAEMALRAQEISQEAGSKIARAMKDVINAAAGLAGFAVESARDVVQYMVRRGQMSQEEADRIIREAEEAQAHRKPSAQPAVARAAAAPPERPAPEPSAPAAAPATPKKGASAKPARPAAKTAKPAAKAPAKKKAPSPSGSARAKSASKTAAGKKRK